MTKAKDYMRRCFELAQKGLGQVAPNPLVGAVIVHNDRIIGEGYHPKYGQAHAEVNAVKSATGNHHLLPESTLYVSLEPCCFHGKTPACTDLILKHRIPRVVISAMDATPQVDGKGVAILRAAGVEVTTGVLQEQGAALVAARSVFVRAQRPYVILKFAQSQDGYMGKAGQQLWISNTFSKRLVHKWRGEADAIMVGTNTARVDDPALTNRLFFGKQPLRIVLDRKASLSSKLQLFDDTSLTLVVSEVQKLPYQNTHIQLFKHMFDEQLLPDLLSHLHQKNIGNLIVEGGRQLLESFIAQGLWDEARVFTGNKIQGGGIAAPKIPARLSQTYKIGSDRLDIYTKK
ncbi:MAG: bifunctional diaminohydroxyphosphoribosylaminopyrimidine deaminase/5-amino-6-(5-phosphoribosylamino)uracil reductase RibD [Bacteroidota bacterium]